MCGSSLKETRKSFDQFTLARWAAAHAGSSAKPKMRATPCHDNEFHSLGITLGPTGSQTLALLGGGIDLFATDLLALGLIGGWILSF
jgi:hypothetical protein